MTAPAAVVTLLLGLSGAPAAEAQEPDPFVGNAMCVRCHQDLHDAFSAAPHGSGNAAEIVEDGCQSCHGPGRAHVQAPNDADRKPGIERMSFEDQNALCTKCHEGMPAFDRTHESVRVSCSSCHVLHERSADLGVMRWQPKCLSCHNGQGSFDELHEYDMAAMSTGDISCRSCHAQAHDE